MMVVVRRGLFSGVVLVDIGGEILSFGSGEFVEFEKEFGCGFFSVLRGFGFPEGDSATEEFLLGGFGVKKFGDCFDVELLAFDEFVEDGEVSEDVLEDDFGFDFLVDVLIGELEDFLEFVVDEFVEHLMVVGVDGGFLLSGVHTAASFLEVDMTFLLEDSGYVVGLHSGDEDFSFDSFGRGALGENGGTDSRGRLVFREAV